MTNLSTKELLEQIQRKKENLEQARNKKDEQNKLVMQQGTIQFDL